jgi:hypothetical protein
MSDIDRRTISQTSHDAIRAAPLPVMTGPGVYRDAEGWGRRIAGRDAQGWYIATPAGRRREMRWNDAGDPVVSGAGFIPARLVARVADLSVWPDARLATIPFFELERVTAVASSRPVGSARTALEERTRTSVDLALHRRHVELVRDLFLAFSHLQHLLEHNATQGDPLVPVEPIRLLRQAIEKQLVAAHVELALFEQRQPAAEAVAQ